MVNNILEKSIATMYEVDQALRLFAKPGKGPLNYLIYAIDGLHQLRLLELIKKYGYPTQKKIGMEGMKKFWLLVQHQDDNLELQKECLKHCDFALPEKAHLTDRILVNSGKPQRYGTQFFINRRSQHVPRPIEDQTRVDVRRKKMGLSTLKAYTVLIRRTYRKKR